MSQMYYVIDTNVLIDYINVIPSPDGISDEPEEATIDLTGAHLVIPTVVIRELSSFKKEKSERGKAARVALDRIQKIVDDNPATMEEIYNLNAPIELSNGQMLSVLPIHKNFKRCLPFSPSENDMDGQIILAALTVVLREAELNIDGTVPESQITSLRSDNVVLLTNDKGLAIRARERGIRAERYGYKYPEPYTGRRDIVVPRELLMKFMCEHELPREEFEQAMPKERKLVANEFIVMTLANPADYPRDFDPQHTPYFEHIGRYDASLDAIVRLKYVTQFPVSPRNAGQAIYAEALMSPDISAVVCTGPAGSGKTFMSTIYGYVACSEGGFIGVTVVPCENRSNLGALPGDLEEKMDPSVQPLKNAIRNYLLKTDKDFRGAIGGKGSKDGKSIKTKLGDRVEMIWHNWFSSVPIEDARGRDFAYEVAIYDEFQDQNAKQADTLIKRIGDKGKVVITGDIHQIHAAYLDQSNNGLVYASQLLLDNPMVAQVCFTEDEIIRHPLVKVVAERQKRLAARARNHSES